MNGLDYVIVVVIAIAALHGLSRGALRMITSVAALVGGLYFASFYYPVVQPMIERPFGAGPNKSAALAFIIVFAGVFIVVEMAGTALMRLLHIVRLGWLDRLAGGVVGAAIGGIVMGLVVMLMAAVMPVDAEVLQRSELAPRLLVYNQALVNVIPSDLKDAYQAKRAEMIRYWLENEARLIEPMASPVATASVGK